jgi:glycosyltransferase involved in cell wall biosynthesis
VKILVLTNLYPPHHAGTFDVRCQTNTEALKLRGHSLKVLTSNHGMTGEQRSPEIDRRLFLNGAFGHPEVSRFREVKALEAHNHGVLREAIANFKPDLIHCYSLHGLSKSLIFSLRHSRVPTVYDVADDWIAQGVKSDPWLMFWNRPGLNLFRAGLELSGRRSAADVQTPTRMMKGYDRVPQLWGNQNETTRRDANSISAFRLDRLYFCSQALKDATAEAGFRVNHAEVIHFGIDTQGFVGDVKPSTEPLNRFLVVGHLDPQSGAMTAVQAMKHLRDAGANAILGIYGQGDSLCIAGIRSYIATHQLPVEFLTVSNLARDLPGLYRRHDALVYPVEWNEPFSTIPLEAMACGLPVIGAQAGGAAELLRHGENALTFTPGDAAGLAQQMEILQRDPKLRARLADTAQQEVISKYNQTSVMDRIENYLQTSLEVWAHAAS